MTERKSVQSCPGCHADIHPSPDGGEWVCQACGYKLEKVSPSQQPRKTQKDIILDKLRIHAENLLKKAFQKQKDEFDERFKESHTTLKNVLMEHLQNIQENLKHKGNELGTTIDKSLRAQKTDIQTQITQMRENTQQFLSEKSAGIDEVTLRLQKQVDEFVSIGDSRLSDLESALKASVNDFNEGQRNENDQFRTHIQQEIQEETSRQKEMLDGILKEFENRFHELSEKNHTENKQFYNRISTSFEKFSENTSKYLMEEFQTFSRAVLQQLSDEYGVEPPPDTLSSVDKKTIPPLKLVEDKKTG